MNKIENIVFHKISQIEYDSLPVSGFENDRSDFFSYWFHDDYYFDENIMNNDTLFNISDIDNILTYVNDECKNNTDKPYDFINMIELLNKAYDIKAKDLIMNHWDRCIPYWQEDEDEVESDEEVEVSQ
jgi:hypothetical protein